MSSSAYAITGQPFSSRTINILILILSLFVQFSCKDDEPSDNILPVVTIVSPLSTDLLKGTISIQASIEESNLSKVEIYFDNNLIAQPSNSSQIELAFDTHSITDGQHELTIAATDASGNRAEANVTVDVLNTLIKFTMPSGSTLPNEDVWFFVSDVEGNIIDVVELPQSGVVTFETPDDYQKGQRITLHHFSLIDYVSLVDAAIISYINILPGQYSERPGNTAGSSLGTMTLTVNNVPATSSRGVILGNVSTYSGSRSGTTNTFTIGLRQNNTGLLSIFSSPTSDRSVVPMYKSIPGATVGTSVNENFSNYASMNFNTITLPEIVDNIYGGVYGIDGSNFYMVDLFNLSDASSTRLYYPNGTFQQYYTSFSSYNYNAGRSYGYIKYGAVPTTIPTLNVSLNSFSVTNKISLTNSGTFDYMSIISDEETTVSGIRYLLYWAYYTGNGSSQQFPVYQLPEEILSKYPKLSSITNKFDFVSMTEFNGISGYDDYIHFRLQTTDSPMSRYSESSGTGYLLDFKSVGGRKNTTGRHRNVRQSEPALSFD